MTNKINNSYIQEQLTLELPVPPLLLPKLQTVEQIQNKNKTSDSTDILSDSYIDHNILD